MRLRLFALLFVANAGLAVTPAGGAVDSQWSEVVRAEEGDCTLTVTGNGKAYRIAATGLGSGAQGRYRLSNGDMVPIDWTIRADGEGEFARYYLPFRWHRRGGTVAVEVATPRCTISAAFEWVRASA